MLLYVCSCRQAASGCLRVRQRATGSHRPGLLLLVLWGLLPLSAGFADASLSPPSPTNGERFGGTLSVSPGRLLAGACKDNDNGTASGSAYLYDEQLDGTWTLAAKLLAADGAAYDEFGGAVSVDGDRAVAGAGKDDDNGSSSGSVYVFERQTDGTWLQAAKLLPADGAASDQFGSAVALSGTRLLAGAPGDDDNGSSSGSVCVFERQTDGTWLQVAKLLPADGGASDEFGGAVALDGDIAAVGAMGEDAVAGSSGAVYLFARQTDGTWAQTAKLKASGAESGDGFGRAVALHESALAAGAPCDGRAHAGPGFVCVFARQADGTWTETAKLVAPDAYATAGDQLGSSVAIDAWRILAGAPGDEPSSTGAAYVFQDWPGTGWACRSRLVYPSGAAGDDFGTAVALHGDTALCGAPGRVAGGYADAGRVRTLTVEHAPTDIALTPAWVADGVAGATVGTLSATDGDEPEYCSYAVTGETPALGLFETSGSALTLKPGQSADWATNPSHTVAVTVTDRTAHTFTRSLTIAVNRLPTADPQTVTLVNAAALEIVLTGTDPDAGPLAYQVTQGPASGTLSGTPPNLTYAPAGLATGTEFQFRVVDALGGASAPATVHVDLPDADGNGLPDWWEMVHFSSSEGFPPLQAVSGADPDADGLSNYWECSLGTDPNDPDTDADGLSDGWEQAHTAAGMEPLVANPIQDAVDAASDNETVVLLPGTYSQKVAFAGRGITLSGSNPADPALVAVTVLQGDGSSGSLVHFGAATGAAGIRGLTLTQGQAEYGGAVYCGEGATVTLADCVLEDNRASARGGGIFAAADAELTVERCTVRHNDSLQGGGIAATAGSTVTLTNCFITGNGDRPLGYPCSDGGGIFVSSPFTAVDLRYCTVAGNAVAGTGDGAGICSDGFHGGDVTVTNSIVFANLGDDQIDCPDAAVSYSCIQGGWAGTGNLGSDPAFTDAANGDYSLQATSPCLDVGSATGAPAVDRYGDPRPCPTSAGQTPGYDLGADEYSSSVLLTITDASGAADPPAGTYNLPWGTQVTVTVAATVTSESGRTRYVLSSIAGTGSAPAEPPGPGVSFTLTAESTVSFAWEVEHLLSLRTIGPGTIRDAADKAAEEGWYPEGSTLTLHAVPDQESVFCSWSGNVPDEHPLGREIALAMSTPRHVLARFDPATYGKRTPGASPDYRLILRPGWNLISFPVLPASGYTELPTWTEICAYNGCSGTDWPEPRLFLCWKYGSHFYYLPTSQPRYGEAYWVHVTPQQGTEAATTTMNLPGDRIRGREEHEFETVHLTYGWNLVGFDSPCTLPVWTGVAGAVWAYSGGYGGYVPVSGLDRTRYGQAYWLFCTQSSLEIPKRWPPDADSDGLYDLWEGYYDCGEWDPDSDGDLLPDGWEIHVSGGNPTDGSDVLVAESWNTEAAATLWEADDLSPVGVGWDAASQSLALAPAWSALPSAVASGAVTQSARFLSPTTDWSLAASPPAAVAFDLYGERTELLSVRLRVAAGGLAWTSAELLDDDVPTLDPDSRMPFVCPLDESVWPPGFLAAAFGGQNGTWSVQWLSVVVARVTPATLGLHLDDVRLLTAQGAADFRAWCSDVYASSTGAEPGSKGGAGFTWSLSYVSGETDDVVVMYDDALDATAPTLHRPTVTVCARKAITITHTYAEQCPFGSGLEHMPSTPYASEFSVLEPHISLAAGEAYVFALTPVEHVAGDPDREYRGGYFGFAFRYNRTGEVEDHLFINQATQNKGSFSAYNADPAAAPDPNLGRVTLDATLTRTSAPVDSVPAGIPVAATLTTAFLCDATGASTMSREWWVDTFAYLPFSGTPRLQYRVQKSVGGVWVDMWAGGGWPPPAEYTTPGTADLGSTWRVGLRALLHNNASYATNWVYAPPFTVVANQVTCEIVPSNPVADDDLEATLKTHAYDDAGLAIPVSAYHWAKFTACDAPDPSYTAPETDATLEATYTAVGDIWRVRAKAGEGDWGPWSDCVVIGATVLAPPTVALSWDEPALPSLPVAGTSTLLAAFTGGPAGCIYRACWQKMPAGGWPSAEPGAGSFHALAGDVDTLDETAAGDIWRCWGYCTVGTEASPAAASDPIAIAPAAPSLSFHAVTQGCYEINGARYTNDLRDADPEDVYAVSVVTLGVGALPDGATVSYAWFRGTGEDRTPIAGATGNVLDFGNAGFAWGQTWAASVTVSVPSADGAVLSATAEVGGAILDYHPPVRAGDQSVLGVFITTAAGSAPVCPVSDTVDSLKAVIAAGPGTARIKDCVDGEWYTRTPASPQYRWASAPGDPLPAGCGNPCACGSCTEPTDYGAPSTSDTCSIVSARAPNTWWWVKASMALYLFKDGASAAAGSSTAEGKASIVVFADLSRIALHVSLSPSPADPYTETFTALPRLDNAGAFAPPTLSYLWRVNGQQPVPPVTTPAAALGPLPAGTVVEVLVTAVLQIGNNATHTVQATADTTVVDRTRPTDLDDRGSPGRTVASVADPVDAVTGEFWEGGSFEVPGQMPIAVSWRYSSHDSGSGVLGPGWRLTPHPQLLRSAQDSDFYTVVEDDGATVTLIDVSADDTLTNVLVRPSDNPRISHAPGLGGGRLHALGASLTYDSTACLYHYRTPEGQVWSYAWAGDDDDEDTKLLLVERTDPAGNRLVFFYDWGTWENDAPYADDRYRLDVSGSANDGQLVRIENTRTGRTVDLRYTAAPEGGVRLAWVAEQYTDETYGRRVDFAYARYQGTGPSLLSGVARSQPCQPAGLSAPAGSPIALLISQTAAQGIQDASYAYTYRGDLQRYLLTHSLRPDGAGLVNVYGSDGLANGRVTEQKTLLGSPPAAVTTTTFAYTAEQTVVTAVRDPSSSSCRTYLYSDLGVTAVVEGTVADTDPTTTLEWNDRRQLIRSVGPDGVETVHTYDDSAPPYRLLGTIRTVPETAAGAGSPVGIAMTSYEYCTSGVPATANRLAQVTVSKAEDTTDPADLATAGATVSRTDFTWAADSAALLSETTYDTAGPQPCALQTRTWDYYTPAELTAQGLDAGLLLVKCVTVSGNLGPGDCFVTYLIPTADGTPAEATLRADGLPGGAVLARTVWTYYPDGSQATVSVGDGPDLSASSFSYDAKGRRVAVTDPEGGTT